MCHRPPKRCDQAIVTYLTEPEISALLAAPDQATWTGRRDHALLAVAIQTGLRASELTSLTISDAHLGTGAHLSCLGKGRRQRITPLTAGTTAILKAWITERGGLPADALFPTRRSTPLSRDALERRVARHTATTALTCPSLAEKKTSPHVIRHSAMRLLNAGVDTTVIALWLGHASVATTQISARARRPRAQRTRPRPDHTTKHPARPLPATRHNHRLPRDLDPCDYADYKPQNGLTTSQDSHQSA